MSIFLRFKWERNQKDKTPEKELFKVKTAIQKAFDQGNGSIELSQVIISKLPHEFEELKNLVWVTPTQEITSQLQLFMSMNSLDYFPKEILNLKNLTVLVFKHNFIKFLPPEIGQLSNLRELAVSNNLLEFLPQELFNLNKLELFIGQPNPYKAPPKEGVFQWNKPESQVLSLKELSLRKLKTLKGQNHQSLLEKHRRQLHYMEGLRCPTCLKCIWESQVKSIVWLKFPPSGQVYPFQFRFCSSICRLSPAWKKGISTYQVQIDTVNENGDNAQLS